MMVPVLKQNEMTACGGNDVVMPIFAHISCSFPFIEENQGEFHFFIVKFPFCIFFLMPYFLSLFCKIPL